MTSSFSWTPPGSCCGVAVDVDQDSALGLVPRAGIVLGAAVVNSSKVACRGGESVINNSKVACLGSQSVVNNNKGTGLNC